jgi:uncharacterized protein YbaP (TraB family)
MKLSIRFTTAFLTIFLLHGSAPFSFAQTNSVTSSVLWKITHTKSNKISYLLGTNHFYGKEWIDSFPLIEKLIDSSNTFICENALSLDSANKAKIQESVLKEARSSRDFFKNDFDLVNNYFVNKTGSGLTTNLDSSNRPKIVVLVQMFSFILSEIAEEKKLKVSATTIPMDAYLLQYAKNAHKTCLGLDDIDVISNLYTSTGLLDGICQSIVNLVKLKNTAVTGPDRSVQSFSNDLLSLITNYNTGHYRYDFDLKSKGESVKTSERNAKWMKSLPKLLQNNNCFIAVGNVHLDTKSGLIQHIIKAGYNVSPIALQ